MTEQSEICPLPTPLLFWIWFQKNNHEIGLPKLKVTLYYKYKVFVRYTSIICYLKLDICRRRGYSALSITNYPIYP